MTRDQDRLQQVRLLLTLEGIMETRAERQLRKEVRRLATLVEQSVSPSVMLLSNVNDLVETFRPTWVKLLSQHYAVTGRAFSARLFARLVTREEKAFRDTFTSAMGRFITKWGLEKARQITRTTREFVRQLIVDGVGEGLGTREIARTIRDQLTGIGRLNPKQRSEVIARTETHSAALYSSHSAVKSLDLPGVQREWIAVEDARTRPTHSAADGQKVGMDEAFTVGGARLMYPGDPNGPPEEIISCRCVLGFIAPEGEES